MSKFERFAGCRKKYFSTCIVASDRITIDVDDTVFNIVATSEDHLEFTFQLAEISKACGVLVNGSVCIAAFEEEFTDETYIDYQLPFRCADFNSLTEALDYAARGKNGYNFYNLRGELATSLSYFDLKMTAQDLSRRLVGQIDRGDRVVIIAETSQDFIIAFFACQYAGIVPVPAPMPVNLGGKDGYISQIRYMIQAAEATAIIGPSSLKLFLVEAAEELVDVAVYDFDELHRLPDTKSKPIAFSPDEVCYVQYSSGSTTAPKGVIGTQKSVNANLHAIAKYGLQLTSDDRAITWLPLYHDMGLVGFVLTPLAAQITADLFAVSDFVRRPLLWLQLISENRSTVTYSPSFGYDLTRRRVNRLHESIDLSCLRVAGIGGDMIRGGALELFADTLAKFGFDRNSFVASYGMAETTVAISFAKPGNGLMLDEVDMRHYTRSGIAQPASAITSTEHKRDFAVCGKALPGHELEVRGENGDALLDREVGRIFVRGPSIAAGYFSDSEAFASMYDGTWLDTGDMGYTLCGKIVITGRAKELIIINGRNIWPQDIEWAVEKLNGIRLGGVAAFSIDDGEGERVVVVVERRGGLTKEASNTLKGKVLSTIQQYAGVPAEVVLARPHSMIMTSSGKLARTKVKLKYLDGGFALEYFDETVSQDSGEKIHRPIIA